MVGLAQRLQLLRTQKELSRPALAAALGLPRMSIEKFETGRQTPTQEQQQKIAAFFGVSLFYLRGESDDPTSMDSWLNGNIPDEPVPAAPKAVAQKIVAQSAAPAGGDGAVFNALLKSASFQTLVQSTVLDVLRSPEGQELLAKAIRKELKK